MLETVEMDDGSVLAVPGIVPKLLGTPGTLRTKAPTLGQHTADILDELGYSPESIRAMAAKGVIGGIACGDRS